MNKLVGALLAGCLLAAPGLWAQERQGEAPDLETMMGENFEIVQSVLLDLSGRRYGTVVEHARTLQQHAGQLSRTMAGQTGGESSLYRSYVYNLQVYAENLEVIARSLEINETTPLSPALGEEISYLHDVAATHFGDIVSTCVACHGRFRPRK